MQYLDIVMFQQARQSEDIAQVVVDHKDCLANENRIMLSYFLQH